MVNVASSMNGSEMDGIAYVYERLDVPFYDRLALPQFGKECCPSGRELWYNTEHKKANFP